MLTSRRGRNVHWIPTQALSNCWRSTSAGAGRVTDLVFTGHRASVEKALLGEDGQQVTTAHGDGTVRIWRCEVCGPIEEVLALAGRRLTRDLTIEERADFLNQNPS